VQRIYGWAHSSSECVLSSFTFYDLVSENVGALAAHSTNHYTDSFEWEMVRLIIVKEE
jgi:hypothetical protein